MLGVFGLARLIQTNLFTAPSWIARAIVGDRAGEELSRFHVAEELRFISSAGKRYCLGCRGARPNK